MKKKEEISKLDKEDWQNYLKNPGDVFDKDFKNNTYSNNRFKFDLHGFTLENANSKVKEIINYCVQNNYRELLLITGKGLHSNTDQDIYTSKDLSKLRHAIPDYIKNNQALNDLIISIKPATITDGGDGAIIIKLKL